MERSASPGGDRPAAKGGKVLYWVRPDFFKHHHIHRRKLSALRSHGLKAEMVCFITPAQHRQHREAYRQAQRQRRIRIIRLPGETTDLWSIWLVRLFFLAQLLRHRRVLIHGLLCDSRPLFRLQRIKVLSDRLLLLTEYEGDLPSELLYISSAGDPQGPSEQPRSEFIRQQVGRLLEQQRLEIEHSRAFLVVSEEHRQLLEQRYQRTLPALVFPTLFDPAVSRFLPQARDDLRSQLGLSDAIVLVHLGGAYQPWHRFAELCDFIRRIHAEIPAIRLLALVNRGERQVAAACIAEAGIESLTSLLSVASEDVPSYLSAADLGLLLRHHHTMTRIVATAKLGEYLACGLPVISTGAHAVYGSFIADHDLEARVDQPLTLTPELLEQVHRLAQRSADPLWRQRISEQAAARFTGDSDPTPAYLRLCERLLAGRSPELPDSGSLIPARNRSC